jgi:cell division protein FtsW (lipid II flippase)
MRLKILAFSLFLLYVAVCAFVLFFMGVTKTTFVVLGVVGGFLGVLIFLVLKKDLQPALARFEREESMEESMDRFRKFREELKEIKSDPKKLAKFKAGLQDSYKREYEAYQKRWGNGTKKSGESEESRENV